MLYHTVIALHKPAYLSNNIKFRTDIHNTNIRRKSFILVPVYRTAIFRRSFIHNIRKIYNELQKG